MNRDNRIVENEVTNSLSVGGSGNASGNGIAGGVDLSDASVLPNLWQRSLETCAPATPAATEPQRSSTASAIVELAVDAAIELDDVEPRDDETPIAIGPAAISCVIQFAGFAPVHYS